MPLSSTKNCIFASYLKKTKIMRIKLISVVILFVLLLGACSAPKDVVYLQGVDTLTPEQISQMNQTYTSRISKDDLLAISVTAPDPSVTTPFNPPVLRMRSKVTNLSLPLNQCILTLLIRMVI